MNGMGLAAVTLQIGRRRQTKVSATSLKLIELMVPSMDFGCVKSIDFDSEILRVLLI